MLAGQMILILVARPQGIASFWALLSYLGGAKDKKLSLDPVLKLNIVLWLTPPWLCEFLSDIGISIKTPIPMHYDNKSAIAIASNPVFHNHTKHIDVDCPITRQAYEKKILSLPYTPSSSQLVDFFTKAQTSPQFRLLLSKLSVYDPP